MILDTSFIIDIMDSEINAVKKLEELSRKNTVFQITTITVYELFYGLGKSSKPELEKIKIKNTIANFITLSLDILSAEIAGEFQGKLSKEGNKIGHNDAMIAGIALMKSAKIITRNIKDFSRVKGLEIESY